MKNLKIFGIVMMLVMGMSFTSCSSDDEPGSEGENGASAGSIEKYFEGEWFLVSEKFECPVDGTDITKWDYDNQKEEGYCAGDEYCDGHEPIKIYIESIRENSYSVTSMHYSAYSNSWEEYESEVYELDGNIIEEYTDEYYYQKVYIKSISSKELVIVVAEKEFDIAEEHLDVATLTYRRNN